MPRLLAVFRGHNTNLLSTPAIYLMLSPNQPNTTHLAKGAYTKAMGGLTDESFETWICAITLLKI